MNTQPMACYYSQGIAIPMQNFDEQQALDGLRELNSHVIGVIYDRYFPEVYRYVRYRLTDEQVAEDVASDVFVRLLEASQKGRGPQSNLKAWLLSTTSHIVADHLRRSYRRPTETLPENLLDMASIPHDEFERREQTREFRKAYAELTPLIVMLLASIALTTPRTS